MYHITHRARYNMIVLHIVHSSDLSSVCRTKEHRRFIQCNTLEIIKYLVNSGTTVFEEQSILKFEILIMRNKEAQRWIKLEQANGYPLGKPCLGIPNGCEPDLCTIKAIIVSGHFGTGLLGSIIPNIKHLATRHSGKSGTIRESNKASGVVKAHCA